MAVPAIDATVSGAAANSYNTEVEARTYFLVRPGGQIWDEIDPERQRAALIFSAILVDREIFWGQKADGTQALEQPRSNMGGTIPVKIKHAQLEQALDLVNSGFIKRERMRELQDQGVRQVSTGRTLTRMIPSQAGAAIQSVVLCTAAKDLLAGFIEFGAIAARA